MKGAIWACTRVKWILDLLHMEVDLCSTTMVRYWRENGGTVNTVPSAAHEAAPVLDHLDQEVSPKLELAAVVDPAVPADPQLQEHDLVRSVFSL